MTWTPESPASTWCRIIEGVGLWTALGDMVDDWHRIGCPEHTQLGAASPAFHIGEQQPEELLRAATLLARAVEYLYQGDGHPAPEWVYHPSLTLDTPWFLYPGWQLRAWQLATTPLAFKARNVFTGDRILQRV